MMRPLGSPILLASVMLLIPMCDDGTRTETAASTARDSSLAHDIALATDDSGASALRDAQHAGSVAPLVATSAGATGRTVAESPGTVGEPAPATGAAASARNVASTSPSAEGYIGPSCASPAIDDQRRCLLGYLERSDTQLDRSYRALITQLESEAGTQPGAAEPATVQRLRTAQRSWFVYRDDECRKRSVEQEGPLWAPVRAKCLAEYSAFRARELDDALAKRKAVTPRKVQAKTKHPTRAKSARSRRRHR
jgi:uncharacterized protein YecT (DUF1311 family)